MRFTGPAAAVLLCATFTTLSISATSSQVASHSPEQFQPMNTPVPSDVSEAAKPTPETDSTKRFTALDSIWIISFAIAGLVLLRKIHGE